MAAREHRLARLPAHLINAALSALLWLGVAAMSAGAADLLARAAGS